MKKNELYEMYLTMIRNAYNGNSIKTLESIRDIIVITPMKYFMSEAITTSQANYLMELIYTNIEMLKEIK